MAETKRETRSPLPLTMPPNAYEETAIKYFVDDLAGARIPGSRLSNILKELEVPKKLSGMSKDFLRKSGLLALLSYSENEISYPVFSKAAGIEQSVRRHAAECIALEKEARRKVEEERRRAFENDPRNIAKAKQLALKRKYGLSYFIEAPDFERLMDILRRVDNGRRLSEDEVVWLSTATDSDTGTEYFTEELKDAYHRNEADFYRTEFEKTQDPWLAVQASSHYRKCYESRTAEAILCSIDVHRLSDIKLKSALCTTRGGVKRDLEEWEDAITLGKQAHEFTPRHFHPCTLLGAVYIETGRYDLGLSWYDKAVERGYREESVDDELRGIYRRSVGSKRTALRDYLLRMDPERYRWVNLRNG